MSQFTKFVLFILIVLFGLVLHLVYSQGPPPPGGVRFPGGNGGPSDNEDLSLVSHEADIKMDHFYHT